MISRRQYDGCVGLVAESSPATGFRFVTGSNADFEKSLDSPTSYIKYWGSPGHIAAMKALGVISGDTNS